MNASTKSSVDEAAAAAAKAKDEEIKKNQDAEAAKKKIADDLEKAGAAAREAALKGDQSEEERKQAERDEAKREAESVRKPTKHEIAREKLGRLVRSYPRDTPDEHIVFGYGGTKITAGDLRDLFGVER